MVCEAWDISRDNATSSRNATPTESSTFCPPLPRISCNAGPVLAVRRAEDLPTAFQGAVKAKASAVIRMVDPLVAMVRMESATLAAKYRLPVIYPFRDDVEAGSLISYGTNLHEQYRQTSTLIDKILRGTKPSELPVEQPTKFELVVNMKTARSLGLVIPPSNRIQAEFIE